MKRRRGLLYVIGAIVSGIVEVLGDMSKWLFLFAVLAVLGLLGMTLYAVWSAP